MYELSISKKLLKLPQTRKSSRLDTAWWSAFWESESFLEQFQRHFSDVINLNYLSSISIQFYDWLVVKLKFHLIWQNLSPKFLTLNKAPSSYDIIQYCCKAIYVFVTKYELFSNRIKFRQSIFFEIMLIRYYEFFYLPGEIVDKSTSTCRV